MSHSSTSFCMPVTALLARSRDPVLRQAFSLWPTIGLPLPAHHCFLQSGPLSCRARAREFPRSPRLFLARSDEVTPAALVIPFCTPRRSSAPTRHSSPLKAPVPFPAAARCAYIHRCPPPLTASRRPPPRRTASHAPQDHVRALLASRSDLWDQWVSGRARHSPHPPAAI